MFEPLFNFLVPADLGATVAFFLIGFSALTSFLTAAAGIGGGVLMIAVMASLVPAAALIPLHGVVQIGSNFGRAALMVKDAQWQIILPFFAGSLVGVALGGLTAVQLPPAILNIGLGLFIIWSAWAKSTALPDRFATVGTGVISSFLTMFFGATGPFVAAMLKRLKLDRMQFVATHAVAMVGQHGVKIIVFGLLGFNFAPYIGFLIAMIAMGFVGTVIGRRVLIKADEDRFQFILSVILTILALRLLYQGVMILIG